jgi:SAM-dependent MidA family methyltransferase
MFRTTHTLPSLTADEQAHSEQLQTVIREELARNQNWMSFDRYMELALYAPGLGYYSAGAHKFGVGGDFITAPEISPLFSRCIANQCAQVLASLSDGSVMELGAGSGVMAAEILLQLETVNRLPVHYYILEISADLQQRQQQLLGKIIPHLLHRVQWLSTLPKNFSGMAIANEVLDALPVKRFGAVTGAIKELGVSTGDSGFRWQSRALDKATRSAVEHIIADTGHAFIDGYGSEINVLLAGWVQSLSESMQRGVMLFVDYGLPRKQYYSEERTHGTLNCFFKHHQHDNPFINVGIQDITAWVDFSALAEAGVSAGLELCGFVTQANFLIGAGIESLLHEAMNHGDITDAQRWKLSQQVQQLMLPDAMGESFKAMAFHKDCDMELDGFDVRDLRHLL